MHVFLVGVALLHSVMSGSCLQDDEHELTEQQTALLQRMAGDWKCARLLRNGDPRLMPENSLIAISINNEGAQYFGNVKPDPEPKWRFERIDTDSARIDMVKQRRDTPLRQALVLRDGNLWIVSSLPAGKKLPEKLEAMEGTIVLVMEKMPTSSTARIEE